MRLLEVIKQEKVDMYIEEIRACLEDRLDWLEDREPEYDGTVHDTWQEKYDDMEEIIELFDDIENNNKEDILEEIAAKIETYQYCYGGLSRLRI